MTEVWPRYVIMALSKTTLLLYLTGKRTLTNVPPDAKIVSLWSDSDWSEGVQSRSRVVLKIEHESFAPVEPGSRIPRIKPHFTEGR